jgi:cellulose synthase/poly-beta-1,6-N-acetylglucosamine synthase-like glycosyltransferase
LQTIIVYLYIFLSITLFLFSCFQLNLLVKYWFKKTEPVPVPLLGYPMITIQLPIYNELYVVERLIEAVMALDYPKNCLEIQILDDSTDETSDIIRQQVAHYQQQNFDIHHIQRTNRVGYKAGALAHGLGTAKGVFIVIFDADFIPPTDFLTQVLPYFDHESVGLVQTRWGYQNENFSSFTQLQALALDGHFRIEQGGRNSAKYFINFNGTAGIWRKSCIDAAGGWSADTIAEDLDLSYRAQSLGWKLKYIEDIVTPAELPLTLTAFKAQQYRWMKGGAECAKKLLTKTLTNSSLSWPVRLQAVYHLLNNSAFIWGFLLSILSVPTCQIVRIDAQYNAFFEYGSLFQIGLLVLALFYYTASYQRLSLMAFMVKFPVFMCLISGLTLHNAIAVIEGYMGYKTPFVRTPKWGNNQRWQQNKYVIERIKPIVWAELILSFYFAIAVAIEVFYGQYFAVPYHLLLSLGYMGVAVNSWPIKTKL